MDKYDLIRDIATKHGVVIGDDDPILITYTLNQQLIEDSKIAHQDLIQTFKETLECLSNRNDFENKQQSERILNASLTASKEAMATLLNASAKETTSRIKADIESMLEIYQNKLKDTKKLAYINGAISLISFCSVLMLVMGFIK